MPVELHCHSTYSDGELLPEDLLERALALGVTTLALTDHDTVAGVEPLIEFARSRPLVIVAGVELSCVYAGKEVHLLGYFLRHRDADFLELLVSLQQERRERIYKILEKLRLLGLDLSFAEVACQSKGEALGRPHVAKALLERGAVGSIDLAFKLYLGNQAPAYVGRSLLSLPEGIVALHKAGGCAVLAHPGLIKDWVAVEKMLELPLDGIEVWHPAHGKAARKRAKKLGIRYGKILCGGSDFHHSRGDYDLGSSTGVSEKTVQRLRLASSSERYLA